MLGFMKIIWYQECGTEISTMKEKIKYYIGSAVIKDNDVIGEKVSFYIMLLLEKTL